MIYAASKFAATICLSWQSTRLAAGRHGRRSGRRYHSNPAPTRKQFRNRTPRDTRSKAYGWRHSAPTSGPVPFAEGNASSRDEAGSNRRRMNIPQDDQTDRVRTAPAHLFRTVRLPWRATGRSMCGGWRRGVNDRSRGRRRRANDGSRRRSRRRMNDRSGGRRRRRMNGGSRGWSRRRMNGRSRGRRWRVNGGRRGRRPGRMNGRSRRKGSWGVDDRGRRGRGNDRRHAVCGGFAGRGDVRLRRRVPQRLRTGLPGFWDSWARHDRRGRRLGNGRRLGRRGSDWRWSRRLPACLRGRERSRGTGRGRFTRRSRRRSGRRRRRSRAADRRWRFASRRPRERGGRRSRRNWQRLAELRRRRARRCSGRLAFPDRRRRRRNSVAVCGWVRGRSLLSLASPCGPARRRSRRTAADKLGRRRLCRRVRAAWGRSADWRQRFDAFSCCLAGRNRGRARRPDWDDIGRQWRWRGRRPLESWQVGGSNPVAMIGIGVLERDGADDERNGDRQRRQVADRRRGRGRRQVAPVIVLGVEIGRRRRWRRRTKGIESVERLVLVKGFVGRRRRQVVVVHWPEIRRRVKGRGNHRHSPAGVMDMRPPRIDAEIGPIGVRRVGLDRSPPKHRLPTRRQNGAPRLSRVRIGGQIVPLPGKPQ